jgi:hypothetical protein
MITPTTQGSGPPEDRAAAVIERRAEAVAVVVCVPEKMVGVERRVDSVESTVVVAAVVSTVVVEVCTGVGVTDGAIADDVVLLAIVVVGIDGHAVTLEFGTQVHGKNVPLDGQSKQFVSVLPTCKEHLVTLAGMTGGTPESLLLFT